MSETPSWKTRNRSFYYRDAPEPDDPALDPASTALLVIDVQNTYVERPPRAALATEAERAQWDAWTPFHARMQRGGDPQHRARPGVVPRPAASNACHARIACRTRDGRDRSLSQKKPGFNNLLLPKDEHASQIVPALAPIGDEIEVIKTTDSALTGTNLRLTLHNLGIRIGGVRRHLHRPVRRLHRAQPRRRELRGGGAGGLLRRRHHGPSRTRA